MSGALPAPDARRPDRQRMGAWRRRLVWLYVACAALVALGVLWQAFTIVAFIRGAGQEARDLHVLGAYVTHTTEIVVFVVALVAVWGDWARLGFALLLPVVGTIQVLVIGDTSVRGGWVNGLHGLLALVVLLLAATLADDGRRLLRSG